MFDSSTYYRETHATLKEVPYHLESKLSLSQQVSPSSAYLPLIYPSFDTIFVHLLKSTKKPQKNPIAFLAVLLPLCCCVHQVASHRLHIYRVVFICYPHPCQYKKSKKRRRKKKERLKKREVKRIECRGCVAGCIITNFNLHIQVGGNLHSSNFISFEHIKPLGLQYRSLP